MYESTTLYFRSKVISKLFYSSRASTFVRKYFRKYERNKVLKVRKYCTVQYFRPIVVFYFRNTLLYICKYLLPYVVDKISKIMAVVQSFSPSALRRRMGKRKRV